LGEMSLREEKYRQTRTLAEGLMLMNQSRSSCPRRKKSLVAVDFSS
jgi:hypothetical protein